MSEEQIKVLIVDDEPLARNYIRKLLSDEADIKIIGEVGNGKDAVLFVSKKKPDLIFLDVQMPEIDGLTMLEHLDSENLPPIIFTTAYEEYAIQAFEFHALDYLLKPFDKKRFKQSIDRAKRIVKGEREQNSLQIKELLKSFKRENEYLQRLLIKVDGRIVFLKTEEIDWIEAEDKYINLFFGESNHLVRQSLKAIKSQLDPKLFIQISRSVIVNVESIKELRQMFNGEYTVVLENKTELNVSRNFKNCLFEVIGKPL